MLLPVEKPELRGKKEVGTFLEHPSVNVTSGLEHDALFCLLNGRVTPSTPPRLITVSGQAPHQTFVNCLTDVLSYMKLLEDSHTLLHTGFQAIW